MKCNSGTRCDGNDFVPAGQVKAECARVGITVAQYEQFHSKNIRLRIGCKPPFDSMSGSFLEAKITLS
jgi:hypothetical protein